MQRGRSGKRESVATRTVVIMSGEGYVLGFMHRQGNSIQETFILRSNIMKRHIGNKTFTCVYTDNPVPEVRAVKGDHPNVLYVLKDLYHCLRLVTDLLDPSNAHSDDFRKEWIAIFWLLNSRGKVWRTIPGVEELTRRIDAFLAKWQSACDEAGNVMTDELWNSILNQRSLAEKGMLSDPAGLNLVLTFQKKFKTKAPETVEQSLRGSNHVESWNSEMVLVGSGNNNSCGLMDTKLVDESTRHNGKRECLIKGLDEPPTADVLKMACIRQMRQECKLPDKYTHIPCLPDLPEQADPVGFQAMMAGLNPEDSDLVLAGMAPEDSDAKNSDDEQEQEEEEEQPIGDTASPVYVRVGTSTLPSGSRRQPAGSAGQYGGSQTGGQQSNRSQTVSQPASQAVQSNGGGARSTSGYRGEPLGRGWGQANMYGHLGPNRSALQYGFANEPASSQSQRLVNSQLPVNPPLSAGQMPPRHASMAWQHGSTSQPPSPAMPTGLLSSQTRHNERAPPRPYLGLQQPYGASGLHASTDLQPQAGAVEGPESQPFPFESVQQDPEQSGLNDMLETGNASAPQFPKHATGRKAMQPLDHNMQQEGHRAAAAGSTQHLAAGQPAHQYSAVAGNAQQFAAVQPGCQNAAGIGSAQDLAAVQQSLAQAGRHIEHPLDDPAPKRICRAGAGRGQPSRRGGPGTGKSCAPCSHEASLHGGVRVPMKDGHTKFCKWCAPCFKTDKLLVLKDAHVCPNIKLKK